MDYSNKILLRDYLGKMDKQYYDESEQSRQYRLLRSFLYANPIIELYDYPELFSSEEEYDTYYSDDLYEKTVQENDPDKLEQMLYVMLFSQAGKFPLRPQITNHFESNYRYDQMRHDLAENQAGVLRDFTEKQRQSWNNTLNEDYTPKSIHQILSKQEKQLRQLVEFQMRQRDNALRYNVETGLPEKEQKKYKQWIWTPNSHTRHSLMADTVVPIDESFHVISTQTHCPDCYLDYPMDISGPICQIAHCKCFAIYTDKKDPI